MNGKRPAEPLVKKIGVLKYKVAMAKADRIIKEGSIPSSLVTSPEVKELDQMSQAQPYRRDAREEASQLSPAEDPRGWWVHGLLSGRVGSRQRLERGSGRSRVSFFSG